MRRGWIAGCAMTSEKGNRTSRCCLGCYHYGHFVGYKGEICELDGKPRKRPNDYTNCKKWKPIAMWLRERRLAT